LGLCSALLVGNGVYYAITAVNRSLILRRIPFIVVSGMLRTHPQPDPYVVVPNELCNQDGIIYRENNIISIILFIVFLFLRLS
jgi:hypothetical protein